MEEKRFAIRVPTKYGHRVDVFSANEIRFGCKPTGKLRHGMSIVTTDKTKFVFRDMPMKNVVGKGEVKFVDEGKVLSRTDNDFLNGIDNQMVELSKMRSKYLLKRFDNMNNVSFNEAYEIANEREAV